MNTIQQIKSRLTIIDAAERYANRKLYRKSNTYWCSCLHKDERTPSMQLISQKNQYRCFSCGDYGDQIDLVSEALNLNLKDTIALLAADLGIETKSTPEQIAQYQEQRRNQKIQQKTESLQEQAVKKEYIRLCTIEQGFWRKIKALYEGGELTSQVENAFRWQSILTHYIDAYLAADCLQERLELYKMTKDLFREG